MNADGRRLWNGGGWLILLAGVSLALGSSRARTIAWAEATPTSVGQAPGVQARGNGYADLVAAGEALRSSERFGKVEQGGASLEAKREALTDPAVDRAMRLLRRGLGKPVSSPRTSEPPPDRFLERAGLPPPDPYADLAKFRSLARLLAMRQEVAFADGRNTDALEAARLGMRLSRAVQTDTLITGQVGLAISALTLTTVGDHLDRLSDEDVERLARQCREWLHAPSLFPRVLDGERRYTRRQLASMGMGPNEEAPFQQLYETALAEWKKPTWQRAPLAVPKGEDRGSIMAGLIVPVLDSAMNSYAREQAQLRLLAVHAAIRRHRARTGRLPADLAQLDLGDIAVDPFTGSPLQYQLQNERYQLTSVGPRTTASDPRAVNGRRPVSVTGRAPR